MFSATYITHLLLNQVCIDFSSPNCDDFTVNPISLNPPKKDGDKSSSIIGEHVLLHCLTLDTQLFRKHKNNGFAWDSSVNKVRILFNFTVLLVVMIPSCPKTSQSLLYT